MKDSQNIDEIYLQKQETSVKKKNSSMYGQTCRHFNKEFGGGKIFQIKSEYDINNL
jgi:hypothetical protein